MTSLAPPWVENASSPQLPPSTAFGWPASPVRTRRCCSTTSCVSTSMPPSISVIPGEGAVCPAIVTFGSVMRSVWRSRSMTPPTSKTMMRGSPRASAARNEPSPSLASEVTLTMRPPRPPGVVAAQPTAPGNASGAACRAWRCPSAPSGNATQAIARPAASVFTIAVTALATIGLRPRRRKASILIMTPGSHTLTGIDGRGRKGLFVLEKTGARAFRAEAELIAQRFVTARQTGEALPAFPGPLPPDLAAAYACQDAAIELVPDTIAGWKVGLIGKDAAAVFKHDRLAGPIFSSSVRESRAGETVSFPVFKGGFAAAEAELRLRLGRDAPEGQREWTRAQARELVAEVHGGVEPAGRTLATINELGPTAIVADFGHNARMIVGPKLPRSR